MHTQTAKLRTLTWTLSLTLIGALVFLLASPQGAVQAQDDFRSLKRKYEDARKEGARTQMGRIAIDMGATGDPKAADFLLGELKDDQQARARKRPGLPGEVREKIIAALASFTDDTSVGKIGDAALALKSDKTPEHALDQFDFFLALARMKDSGPADASIRKAIADPKNAFVKVAALEAVRQAKAVRFTEDVLAVLQESNEDWFKKWVIVPINVFACLTDLVQREQREMVERTVETIIEWEEKKLCSDERVRYFGGRLLHSITGEIADMSSTGFWKWWLTQMRTVGHVKELDKAPERRSKTVATPPVFDAQPVGRRFVFVIDVSRSMEMPLKITLEEIEKRREDRDGPVSGERRRREGDGGPEVVEDNNPLRKLPWQDIKSKIDLAREELSRAISDFVGDRYFAIIIYSTSHELLTEGWIHATPENCKKWARQVKDLQVDAMTNIHGSLMHALRLSSKGNSAETPAVDPDCVLTGADSIVFLTDGWGSWDDLSVGRTTDKRNKQENTIGDGPFIYGEDIWPDILRHNIFRKVVINTVGIGHHDKDLLMNLAKRSAGKYVDWGFTE